jgi:predicted SAM-dependent methyltransferase
MSSIKPDDDIGAKMKYLNLGCGIRYHPEWINIDIAPSGKGVISHDLSQGIPLADRSCDAVYHSHLIEHLRQSDALQFMRECHRVMKPGAILRVAAPDLEQICRVYLEKLEQALKHDQDNPDDYDWIMLELLDQTVREQSGGGMLGYLSRSRIPNEDFIYERIGEEGRNLVRLLKAQSINKSDPSSGRIDKLTRRKPIPTLQTLRSKIRRRLLTRWLGSDWRRPLEIGRFRLAGEVHQWMYDRYSLARLMLWAGFQDPILQSATQSHIPDWPSFNLDTLADGTVVKPDSLFMEAKRPV